MLDKNSIEDKKVIRRIQSGETEDSQICGASEAAE